MTAWEIIFGWNDGKQNPKVDGIYYVAQHRHDGLLDISTVSYTVAHGWNSTPNDEGKHAFEYYNKFWWIPAVRVHVEEAYYDLQNK